jgi:hypothetical protein
MLRRGALLSVAALLVWARPALADLGTGDDNWESGYDPGKQKRRSDFTAGLGLGPVAFGSASGYPNEVAKIGDPKYEANTGFGGGNATSLWIGVAFRDWMVFGVGAHFYTIQSTKCPVFLTQSGAPDDCVAAYGGAFMMHIEAFPFFYRAPALENLGIFTEMGAGTRNIARGSHVIAEGGFLAFLSLGVAYEPIRVGDHLSFGPYIQGSHEFSETLRDDQLVIGFRGVYYGGP